MLLASHRHLLVSIVRSAPSAASVVRSTSSAAAKPIAGTNVKTFEIYRYNPDNPASKPTLQVSIKFCRDTLVQFILEIRRWLEWLWTYGSRCAYQDKEWGGSYANFSSFLSRRHLWVLRHEYRRRKVSLKPRDRPLLAFAVLIYKI